MNYAQFRSFLAVVDEGGFSAAARRLKLSQPTVTQQVRELEQRFGIELLFRRGNRMELTSTGRSLAALILRFFRAEEEAVDFMRSVNQLESGHLTVAAVGPYFILNLLAEFHRKYPAIGMNMWTGNSREVIAAVKEYRADVAFAASPESDRSLFIIARYSHPIVLLVSHHHPWAKRREINLSELHGQDMVLREKGSYSREAFESLLKKNSIRPNVVMEIRDRESYREAVAEGIGIGPLREQAFVPNPKLRTLRIKDAKLELSTYIACLRERKDTGVIRAFREVVAHSMSSAHPHHRSA